MCLEEGRTRSRNEKQKQRVGGDKMENRLEVKPEKGIKTKKMD